MLYSCADWLTTDVALPQDPASQYVDFDAMHQPQQAPRSTPVSVKNPVRRQSFQTPLLSLPPSPSAVDDLMRSPRSFEELQRGSLSLARSIEEFNAIIDADMSGEYYGDSATATSDENPPLLQLLDAVFFESSCAASSNGDTPPTSSSAIKYGWTPFDVGEFQFASVERDDASLRRRRW